MVQTRLNKIFQEVDTMEQSKEITYEKDRGEKTITVFVERNYKGEASAKELILRLLKRQMSALDGNK